MCRSKQDDEIAAFLAQQSGTIALLGDAVSERGTPEEFDRCCDPLCGLLKDRLRLVVGNHEYGSRDAGPSFESFGVRAGLPGQGWYPYDLGERHVIGFGLVLQGRRCVRREVATITVAGNGLLQPASTIHARVLAYPRWSSVEHRSFESMQSIRILLARPSVDVLSGHDHDDERFQPLDTTLTPLTPLTAPDHGRGCRSLRRRFACPGAVPEVGLEPTRGRPQRFLSLAFDVSPSARLSSRCVRMRRTDVRMCYTVR